jgi:AcrR family transcriptional regulator
MAGTREAKRTTKLEELVLAGAQAFARKGYRQTQIADIARDLGVSPGNLYNYVDSKDALFHLVLRHGLGERPTDAPLELPVSGTSVRVTAEWVAQRLDFVSDFPVLEKAFQVDGSSRPRDEIEAIAGELFDVLSSMRLAINAIEQSVDEVPELAMVFGQVRQELFARYERYLRQRSQAGLIRVQHPHATAQLIVELCWWGAGRRPDDIHARSITDAVARETVCGFVSAALLTAGAGVMPTG